MGGGGGGVWCWKRGDNYFWNYTICANICCCIETSLSCFSSDEGREGGHDVVPLSGHEEPFTVESQTSTVRETIHEQAEVGQLRIDIDAIDDIGILCNDSTAPLEPGKCILRVHRQNVKADMIKFFSDPSIMDCIIEVIAIDCRGIEECGRGVGVLRDILSLFWRDVCDSLFIGEAERVPFVRHDYNRGDWEAVGRIFVKGYLTCQFFPLLISKTFLAHVLFGEKIITGPMLIESFRQYISSDERKLIDKCLSNTLQFESDEGSELMETLSNFDCRRVADKNNVKTLIQEIAHKELVQKPQYIADCWKEVILALVPSFPNLESLMEKYQSLVPSISNVLSCIQADPVNDAERESLKFLKRFIRGLDSPQKLSSFLRFISRSELMLFESI